MAGKARALSKRLTPGQQIWLTHLKACEVQGCSSVAYAREHGLSIAALYAARKDLTHRGIFRAGRPGRSAVSNAPVTLVPVQVHDSAPVSMSPPNAGCVLRVVLPNGVVIEVPEQAEPARCQALAAVLSGVGR